MKSMWPPLAAIFFMTYFYRAGGGHGPLGPPPVDPLLCQEKANSSSVALKWVKIMQIRHVREVTQDFTPMARIGPCERMNVFTSRKNCRVHF